MAIVAERPAATPSLQHADHLIEICRYRPTSSILPWGMPHLESFRTNTVDAPSDYVAVSRARDSVAVYTDSRPRLLDALGSRDGGRRSGPSIRRWGTLPHRDLGLSEAPSTTMQSETYGKSLSCSILSSIGPEYSPVEIQIRRTNGESISR